MQKPNVLIEFPLGALEARAPEHEGVLGRSSEEAERVVSSVNVNICRQDLIYSDNRLGGFVVCFGGLVLLKNL